MAHESRQADTIEITPAMIEAGADALWSEVDGDYVRVPLSRCRELSSVVLRAAMLRVTSA